MAMHNGYPSVRMRQLVMISPAQVDKSGLFKSPDEFAYRHKLFIHIMRINVKVEHAHYVYKPHILAADIDKTHRTGYNRRQYEPVCKGRGYLCRKQRLALEWTAK